MNTKFISIKKLIILAVLIILVFISAMVYITAFRGFGEMKITKQEIRQDKEPIMSRFPKLGNFERCLWKADIIGPKNRTLAPGPTSYWMKGYVFLNQETFKRFKSEFKWTLMNKNWKPALNNDVLQNKSVNWAYSEEFNTYIKPPSYIGSFYLEIEHGIIYFEVEK